MIDVSYKEIWHRLSRRNINIGEAKKDYEKEYWNLLHDL